MNGEGGAATGSVKSLLADVFGRLNSSEQDLTRLDTEVKGLRGDVSEIKLLLQGLAGRINRGTDWNVLAAWAGLVLMVGKLALDPMAERVATLEAERTETASARIMVERMDAAAIERARWEDLEGRK